MDIIQNIDVNVNKTVENSVAGSEDFHFYIDELTENDHMPPYSGNADEKYAFDEMNDKFFEYIEEKSLENGIYIRLIFVTELERTKNEVVFKLEYGNHEELFRTDNIDNVSDIEFADYGIKVKKDEVTLGATVEDHLNQNFYFGKFGENNKFLSLNNPLNIRIIELIDNMIIE